MSRTLNSRIFLFIMVLAVFLLSFKGVTAVQVETKTHEFQVERGWCCHDGKVFPSTPEECRERGGQFFPTREEAEESCAAKPGPGILQIPDLKRLGWQKYAGKTVFILLRQNATGKDFVFIFTTNHGGGFCNAGLLYWGKMYYNLGGRFDANTDEGAADSIVEKNYNMDLNSDGDKFDTVSWDEELCSWGGSIFDDNLGNMFANIKYKKMVIVMEQCFSGGLIRDIGQNRTNMVIMSAAAESEVSYGMNSGNYDEFSYYFTCAINGADPSGNKVNADTNNDKKVSMVEAFNYARSKDTQSETPQYEDSGDGISHSGKMPGSGEGTLGSKTFLKQQHFASGGQGGAF